MLKFASVCYELLQLTSIISKQVTYCSYDHYFPHSFIIVSQRITRLKVAFEW